MKTRPVIVGIGEILFDIVNGSEELGGAPTNFAYHANRLGARGVVISTVGDDNRGHKAFKELELRELTTACISIHPGIETGYVLATVDEAGVASYKFPDNIAWDHISLRKEALDLAEQVEGICFGSLAQRSETSRDEIYRYLDLIPSTAIKVFDLNLRQDFFTKEVILKSLEYADILKLNDDELPVLAKILGVEGGQKEQLAQLVHSFNLRLAALTRGGAGSVLVSANRISEHPGITIADLKDTIGAGDAFTAATLISFLQGKDLDEINQRASEIAAKVCSHQGAMPVLKN